MSRYWGYYRCIRRSVIWNTKNAILGPGKKNSQSRWKRLSASDSNSSDMDFATNLIVTVFLKVVTKAVGFVTNLIVIMGPFCNKLNCHFTILLQLRITSDYGILTSTCHTFQKQIITPLLPLKSYVLLNCIDDFLNIYRVIISKFFNLFCTFYWRYWRRLTRFVRSRRRHTGVLSTDLFFHVSYNMNTSGLTLRRRF